MGFQRIKENKVDTRLSDTDFLSLEKIKEMGEFSNSSEAVRFCIKFTSSLLKTIPVTLIANMLTTYNESDTSTVPEGDAAENDSQKSIDK
jgi:Arc/MetJ-type ribon-helix-helix transcriptional regulator